MDSDNLALRSSIKRAVAILCRDRGSYLFAGTAVLLFAIVFGADIMKSERFWKDLRDVRATFEPFVIIAAVALGAAATYLANDRASRR